MGIFAAILNTDGGPVDGRLLKAMVDVAPYDAARTAVWTADGVGLGAAPLRSPDRQTPSLNRHDHATIVMDGRLDDRTALIRRCEADLDRPLTAAADAELVLAAYERWGTGCAARLLGDFSFCIWDGARRQLVCGRDHFGVKPLYVARVGPAVVISNVLRAIRRYPGISTRFDDLAVGDVLLFGLAMDPSRTMFADVSRVPAAHVLVCSNAGTCHQRRYWALEPPALRKYRDEADAVDEFDAALRLAVADRVRSGPVGVLMSGGLDSSSVAATAAGVLGAAAPESLRAFTGIYETVAADEEAHYSSLVAARLNIRIERLPLDGYSFFDRWDSGGLPPEPTTEPLTSATADLLARAGDHSAAVLTGDGGDSLLLPSPLIAQIGHVPFRRLLAGAWASLRAQTRPPLGVRASLRSLLRRDAEQVPAWLAEPLRRSFDARARWAEISAQRSAQRGPRSLTVNDLTDPWWPSTFETYDPGATARPVDLRYPFFDVRLVDVALRLPSFPFCVNKHVLRTAVRGRLPDAVVRRPKAPLAVSLETFHGPWSLPAAIEALTAVPAMDQYVDVGKFKAVVRPDWLFTDRARGSLAAVSLAVWLRHAAPAAVLA